MGQRYYLRNIFAQTFSLHRLTINVKTATLPLKAAI